MLNISTAIEREFQPKYSFSWYMTRLFILVAAGAYITSKVLGEKTDRLIEIIGISAIGIAAYSLVFTLKAVEFGTKIKLRYALWPAQTLDYTDILEIRLPEIAINLRKPIKFENIINLDELQQEFKSLELMGVIPRGRVKELKPLPSKYNFKPKLSNIIWALLTAFILVSELFSVSKEVSVLWLGIIVVYFAADIFQKLFGKPKDE